MPVCRTDGCRPLRQQDQLRPEKEEAVKRFALAILALLIAVPVMAQYPAEVEGLIARSGIYEDIQLVTGAEVNLPWSTPAPDYDTGPLVNIEVWTMMPENPENPYASQIFVEITCRDRSNITGECHFPGIPGRTRYQWDPESKSYLNVLLEFQDGSRAIDLWTWKGDHWRHFAGHVYFEAHPPQYFWWTWYYMELQPTISLPPKIEGTNQQTARTAQ